MPIALESLPTRVMKAYIALRTELVELLGDQLVALWGFGAATMSDAPKRLGDIDSYGILLRAPDHATAEAIDSIHHGIARDQAIEWDSWYVLADSATAADIPLHAFRDNLPDTSWALHRAHWLAGHYVRLIGKSAERLVSEPSWNEIEEALGHELAFVNKVASAHRDPDYCAFAVWNGCRILYSYRTRDVVVSKRAAAGWALQHLPEKWHELIRAAGRAYDDEFQPGDAAFLERRTRAFADFVSGMSAELISARARRKSSL
jgi:hypothetical protein